MFPLERTNANMVTLLIHDWLGLPSAKTPSDALNSCRTRTAFPTGSVLVLFGRMRMGAADARRHDPGGDVKVPDRRGTACSKLCHELRHIIQLCERLACDAESTHDIREVATAEHRTILRQSLRAQLVQLGAVGAIVHHHDEDVQPMALDGIELLHMHYQATVTVEEDNGPIRPRRRDSHGERDAVADGAELADAEEPLLWTRWHLREEPRAVAARVHHFPVLRQ